MFHSPHSFAIAAPVPAFGRAAAVRAPAPRFRLVVDLGEDLFSRRWWRGAATLAGLCGLLGLLAPPLEPLPAGPPIDRGPDQALQARALAIAPLSAGSNTGLVMSEGPRARMIAVAPERQSRDLTLLLSAGDDLARLLRRSGATSAEAVQAARLAQANGALPAAGTNIALRLGAARANGRSIERLHYRARLDLDLTIARETGGGLSATRTPLAIDRTPLRIRGGASGGLYWALRSAGASPAIAADYLQAIGAIVEVGSEIAPADRFELVVAQARSASGEVVTGGLLYAGLDRGAAADLSLVRWPAGKGWRWIEAEAAPEPQRSVLGRPVDGPVTSGFGPRIHPILRFARMHRGLDFGAPWGAPILAAADGQVIRAGWAGGYGRQVRLAHGGGLVTSYSHMSRIVAPDGGLVRRGELIGYVGSSGLSTGPHLHYEVLKDGVAVNPAAITLVRNASADPGLQAAVRARARQLRGL